MCFSLFYYFESALNGFTAYYYEVHCSGQYSTAHPYLHCFTLSRLQLLHVPLSEQTGLMAISLHYVCTKHQGLYSVKHPTPVPSQGGLFS